MSEQGRSGEEEENMTRTDRFSMEIPDQEDQAALSFGVEGMIRDIQNPKVQ